MGSTPLHPLKSCLAPRDQSAGPVGTHTTFSGARLQTVRRFPHGMKTAVRQFNERLAEDAGPQGIGPQVGHFRDMWSVAGTGAGRND